MPKKKIYINLKRILILGPILLCLILDRVYDNNLTLYLTEWVTSIYKLRKNIFHK